MRVLAVLPAIGVALLAAGAGVAGSSPKTAGSRWVVTDLGNLGRAGVTVSDINDRGQVVGGSRTKSGGSRGFVWQNGSMRALGQGPFAGAAGINERGQIIGTSSSASIDRQHAVLWEKGRMIDLLPLGGVTAINERGRILGFRYVPVTNGLYSTPVFWENGKTRNLLPGGSASAINNRGQVVGVKTDGHAALWQNGKVTDLGLGVPLDINDHGQIVGYRNPTGDEHGFLWRNGKNTDLGPGTTPVAINERGQVTGFRGGTACGERCAHAFLWQNGTSTDLGTLGGRWSYPMAISNRGQIVGYSLDRRGVQRAFLWQNGTMIELPWPSRNAHTRAIAINEHNQIIGDNCLSDCELRAGWAASKFAVIWTLRRG